MESRAFRALVILMAVAAAPPACKRKEAPAPAVDVGAACPTPAERTGAVAWYVDDLPGAQACAKAKQLPLVVDLWAPWCHTCLSMKHFVFPDPGLAPMAQRFVFASIDTDKPSNAATVAALPIASWPTFYVVAPEDLAVQARFVGSATVAQFRNFLADGERGYVARTKVLAPGSADALLRDGERALAKGDATRGGELLLSALQKAPKDWPRRNDVLVELIQGREKAKDIIGCLSIAGMYMGGIGKVASRTDFLSFALMCGDISLPVPYAVGRRGWAPTVQLTAYLRGLPADGWLRVVCTATEIGQDWFDEDHTVVDSSGRIVVQTRQLALVPPG